MINNENDSLLQPVDGKTSQNPDSEKGGPTHDLGFVFALPMEAAGVLDRLKQKKTVKGNVGTIQTGLFEDIPSALIVSGVGCAKALQAVQLLHDTYHPKRIVSAGYAGALSPRLKRFNVCFPQVVVRQSNGLILDLTHPVPHPIKGPCPDKLGLLTTDFVVASKAQKTELARTTATELVDMETFALAEFCWKHYTPFLSVRIILDTLDDEFPPDIRHIFKSTDAGSVRLAGSILGSVFRRPASLKDLYHIRENALRATDRLALFLAKEVRDYTVPRQ